MAPVLHNCLCLYVGLSVLTSKVLRPYDHFLSPRQKSGDLEKDPQLCSKRPTLLF